jgi:integrase/recombinase XerC
VNSIPATPGSSGTGQMEPLNILIAGFLDYQKGCGLSRKTIIRSGYLLNKFFRWLGDKDIRDVARADIRLYREYLKKAKSRIMGRPISPQSRRLEMCTLKSFFEYLLRQEKILVNPLEGMKMKSGSVKKIRKIFTEEDISIFLDSIPVDRAIFELMYSSGLRVGDIRNLEVEHLNLEERILMVRGKGRKDAYIPFSEVARKFLVKYLKQGRKTILKLMYRTKDKRYVFIAHRGKLNYHRLHARFHNYLLECGLDKKGYTMHSIRHAIATHLLAHGASIRYVQELLRHEDLKTTQLYTRPTVENIRAVYMTYHPRCNEYYKELDKEYCRQVQELKERLIWGRKASKQYKRYGHKKGFGKWKRGDKKK